MRLSVPHTLVAAAVGATMLTAAPALVSAQQVQGVKDRVFSISERVGSGGDVRIFARQGDITISEGTGSTVEFRAEKDERRGRLEEIGFIVRKDGDGVTICAVYADDDDCDADGLDRHSGRWNWGRRSLHLAITVKVPRGVRLNTASGNGDILLVANVAEARIASGNGKLRISGVSGRVDASSGNGEVSVDNTTGPVQARSGNGDITIGTVNGPVNASSGNGDIRVRMDKLAGSDDMEFSSGNGRVEVVVPSDFSADVEANSGNGRITTDFPITIRGKLSPSRLRGTIGNGGRRLRMSTGNGSMEIRRAS